MEASKKKLISLTTLFSDTDCTVLPLLTVLTPFLSSSMINVPYLDFLAHRLAIFFVTPLAAFNSIYNYTLKKHSPSSLLTALGGFLIFATHVHWPHAHPFHFMSCGSGAWHRILSIAGCVGIIGGGRWAKGQGGKCCGHDH